MVVDVYSRCCGTEITGTVSLVAWLSASCRFRTGAQQVVDAVNLRETAEDVARKTGASRFAAVVNLEQIVESHPHKASILKALKKRADKDYAGREKGF